MTRSPSFPTNPQHLLELTKNAPCKKTALDTCHISLLPPYFYPRRMMLLDTLMLPLSPPSQNLGLDYDPAITQQDPNRHKRVAPHPQSAAK